MNLHDGKARLSDAALKLRAHWADTQAEWRDAVSHEFEENHLAPLEPKINTVLRAIESMQELLSRVEQECR
ncbi:MAG TPA: hypothetical protein VGJ26_22520 [Pirellulales bacterium]|jgi:hypothetical protein